MAQTLVHLRLFLLELNKLRKQRFKKEEAKVNRTFLSKQFFFETANTFSRLNLEILASKMCKHSVML